MWLDGARLVLEFFGVAAVFSHKVTCGGKLALTRGPIAFRCDATDRLRRFLFGKRVSGDRLQIFRILDF